MKRFVVALALLMIAVPSLANDGGVAAISVDQIKMREMKSSGEIKQKIARPSFDIQLEGGEAKKLQQILPSEFSVITMMQPELTKEFNSTFKTLAIQSKDANGVTGKVIQIQCRDGELVSNANSDKLAIKKLGKTICLISINAGQVESDTTTFTPACKN